MTGKSMVFDCWTTAACLTRRGMRRGDPMIGDDLGVECWKSEPFGGSVFPFRLEVTVVGEWCVLGLCVGLMDSRLMMGLTGETGGRRIADCRLTIVEGVLGLSASDGFDDVCNSC